MKSRNLIVCDSEEGYAKALAMFFMRKKELVLQVHVCSSPEHVFALENEINADILLVGEEYVKEIKEKGRTKKIFILATGSASKKSHSYPEIYKYQSGEKILRVLVQECTEVFGEQNMISAAPGGKKKKIIGVFSPVHRVGKTTYALRHGEKLAESENVLYLNLEIIGGTDGHFERESQTMADALYYARQEKSNLGLILTTMVCHKGNLDYIAPMRVSEDMKSVKGSEWVQLIQKILEQSIYETLVLDIDEGISELEKVLSICTEIHMLTLKDEFSRAKIRQFEQEMRLIGGENILKKIVRKAGRE